ncbi:hypothetical protein RvY_10695 [Ramazzottius varieornatus]|uniref:UBC core domain-containing protein n=1 Tax=Ramazzottius varieornatus TaxID=947166 RepID=A0A1D1VDM8_RAMVA|nr:hypothetical protein RvY_10695 [Ramazzottius varieornatus]
MDVDMGDESSNGHSRGGLPSLHDTKLEADLRALLAKLSGQCITASLTSDIIAALKDINRHLHASVIYVHFCRQDEPDRTLSADNEEKLRSYLGFGTNDERWNTLLARQREVHGILTRLKDAIKATRLDLVQKSLGLRTRNPKDGLWVSSLRKAPAELAEEAGEKQSTARWLNEVIPGLTQFLDILSSQDFFSLLWERLFGQDMVGKTESSNGHQEDISLPVSSCQPVLAPASAEPSLLNLKREDLAAMEDLGCGKNAQGVLEGTEAFDLGKVRELPYDIQWQIRKYVEFNRMTSENTIRQHIQLQTVPVIPEQHEKKSVTADMLPFDLWRKILRYVDDDDSVLYSLIEASEKFRTLLRQETRERINRPEYWKNALIRRGVNVYSYPSTCPKKDRKNWNDNQWYDRYKKYVKTLACFCCFSRLSTVASGKPVVTHEFHGRISIEATRLARGQAGALDAEENQDHVARPRLKDIGIQVLGVQFCDWDVAKSPAQQTSFDNLIVTLLGPPNTPYVGGRFQLLIHFPVAFPFEPPQARMLTKIVSPYFTDHGDFYYKFNSVCGGGTNLALPTYREYWLLIYDIGYIVNIVARYLTFMDLDKVDGETPAQLIVVNQKHNELFEKNRVAFDAQARKCTAENAMAHWDVRSKGFSS